MARFAIEIFVLFCAICSTNGVVLEQPDIGEDLSDEEMTADIGEDLSDEEMTADEKRLMDEEMKINETSPPVEFAAETDECCEDDPHCENEGTRQYPKIVCDNCTKIVHNGLGTEEQKKNSCWNEYKHTRCCETCTGVKTAVEKLGMQDPRGPKPCKDNDLKAVLCTNNRFKCHLDKGVRNYCRKTCGLCAPDCVDMWSGSKCWNLRRFCAYRPMVGKWGSVPMYCKHTCKKCSAYWVDINDDVPLWSEEKGDDPPPPTRRRRVPTRRRRFEGTRRRRR